MNFPEPPPHSIEAEQATLGAMLIDADRVVDVIAKIRGDDFHDPVHRAIFEAIVDLSEERKPVDFLTVTEKLKGHANLQAAGGGAYLAELSMRVPTSANALEYAEIIRDKAVHRRIASAGRAISTLACDDELNTAEVMERAEQEILAISCQAGSSDPQHISDVCSEAYDDYVRLHEASDPQESAALRTGFADLDSLVDGLEPGALMVIAARPSMGKTAMALGIAREVSEKQGKTVAIFSLEMTKRQLHDRIVASVLGSDTWKLKKGRLTDEEFRKLDPLFDRLQKHPLYLDDDPNTTIANLRSKARRQKLKHGLDLLVIDYLQLIEVTDRAARDNRTQQVTVISRSLKNLARELGCPIIALSQLSRLVEQRSPPIPILSDLRDSGSIEQDADIVLMLYREEAYNEDCQHPGVTDVYVRKNRNGATGKAELFFDSQRMLFRSLAKGHK